MSQMGLGRVKTPTFNLRVEIPSRFRKFENQKYLRPLLREDDRENNSAHSWLVHVFTQPGHSRPNWAVCAMSGLPPIATELRTSLEVRFVPSSDIRTHADENERSSQTTRRPSMSSFFNYRLLPLTLGLSGFAERTLSRFLLAESVCMLECRTEADRKDTQLY
jgi:hypothetical protein